MCNNVIIMICLFVHNFAFHNLRDQRKDIICLTHLPKIRAEIGSTMSRITHIFCFFAIYCK